jgi:DNA polymerase-3 subunit delta'
MACNCAGESSNTVRQETTIPCGTCKPCLKNEAGNHPDIIRVKPSGPFIKIDQIRSLCHTIAMKPYEAKRRVVIISDSQAMNPAASNALLKMLEEPPVKTILILLATHTSELLPTIVSRCQQLRFKPISSRNLESVLVQKHGIGAGDARIIAAMAGGSLSRALRMHRTNWIDRRNWLINEMDALPAASVNRLLALAEQLSKSKNDLQDSLDVMKSWLRDLAVGRINPERIVNQDLASKIGQVSKQMSTDVILEKIDTIQATQSAIGTGTNLRLALETMMLKLAKA